ncbi:MAG: hypothetical protein ACQSGP_30375 [Frankia sp.]
MTGAVVVTGAARPTPRAARCVLFAGASVGLAVLAHRASGSPAPAASTAGAATAVLALGAVPFAGRTRSFGLTAALMVLSQTGLHLLFCAATMSGPGSPAGMRTMAGASGMTMSAAPGGSGVASGSWGGWPSGLPGPWMVAAHLFAAVAVAWALHRCDDAARTASVVTGVARAAAGAARLRVARSLGGPGVAPARLPASLGGGEAGSGLSAGRRSNRLHHAVVRRGPPTCGTAPQTTVA